MKYKLDMYLFNNDKNACNKPFICPMFVALYSANDEILGTFENYNQLAKYFNIGLDSYKLKNLFFTHEGDKQKIKIKNKIYYLYSYYNYNKVQVY